MPSGVASPVDTGLDQTEVVSWIEDFVALGDRATGEQIRPWP